MVPRPFAGHITGGTSSHVEHGHGDKPFELRILRLRQIDYIALTDRAKPVIRKCTPVVVGMLLNFLSDLTLAEDR